VLEAAGELSQQGEILREEVDKFLTAVRRGRSGSPISVSKEDQATLDRSVRILLDAANRIRAAG
jgi:hypothetical protein